MTQVYNKTVIISQIVYDMVNYEKASQMIDILKINFMINNLCRFSLILQTYLQCILKAAQRCG